MVLAFEDEKRIVTCSMHASSEVIILLFLISSTYYCRDTRVQMVIYKPWFLSNEKHSFLYGAPPHINRFPCMFPDTDLSNAMPVIPGSVTFPVFRSTANQCILSKAKGKYQGIKLPRAFLPWFQNTPRKFSGDSPAQDLGLLLIPLIRECHTLQNRLYRLEKVFVERHSSWGTLRVHAAVSPVSPPAEAACVQLTFATTALPLHNNRIWRNMLSF